jgi:hypothetical protein
MKWFRANIRGGSRLALFALAVQFALSFGHVHAFAVPSSPVLNAGAVLAQLVGLSAPAAQASPDDSTLGKSTPVKSNIDKSTLGQSIPGEDRDQQPVDGCAICAVMAMAHALLLSPAPVLVLPAAIDFVPVAVSGTFIRLTSTGLAFQPRAPPAS